MCKSIWEETEMFTNQVHALEATYVDSQVGGANLGNGKRKKLCDRNNAYAKSQSPSQLTDAIFHAATSSIVDRIATREHVHPD